MSILPPEREAPQGEKGEQGLELKLVELGEPLLFESSAQNILNFTEKYCLNEQTLFEEEVWKARHLFLLEAMLWPLCEIRDREQTELNEDVIASNLKLSLINDMRLSERISIENKKKILKYLQYLPGHSIKEENFKLVTVENHEYVSIGLKATILSRNYKAAVRAYDEIIKTKRLIEQSIQEYENKKTSSINDKKI